MAQPLDFTLPYNDLTQYVPQHLRNPVIKGLIDNLFNRFMTHDESIPLYGYIGRKPSSPDDRTGKIPQTTVERDINAVIPILNFDLGTKKYAYTVQDIINKAHALGITNENQRWLYSQSNNYLPPIDIDKFSNFYNYFWVAKSLPTAPVMPWNTELLPEYYTISKPALSDLDKPNALVATTTAIILTGTGFEDQTFTVQFLSELIPGVPRIKITANNYLGSFATFGPNATGPSEYTISLSPNPVPSNLVELGLSVSDTIAFGVTDGLLTKTLVTFRIVRDPIYNSAGQWYDQESFALNDTFVIDTIFLSRTSNVSFTVSPGVKGKFTNIEALYVYQSIDGVVLQEGVRVLVKNNSAVENGIYIVGPQSWSRAPDYEGVYIVPGARVWITGGTVNGGKLFTSGPGNSWPPGVVSVSNTNDWQEGNFWVHSSELGALNLSRGDATQAVRPIIEYSSTLQLNSYVTNGIPTDTGSGFYKQEKTEFNQLPLFDLYRYDGTHASLVSAVFYYVEDLTAPVDLDLQKRVKTSTSDSADLIFNHGLADSNGDLLFYKENSALKTIWHAGYSSATYIDQTFVGGARGSITELIPTTISVPQTWTFTAVSIMTFEAVGSIAGTLPQLITVGIPYEYTDFGVTITNGIIPFSIGDAFTFDILLGPSTTPVVFIGPVKGTLGSVVPTPNTQQQIWVLTATSPTTFAAAGSKLKNLPSPFDSITVGVPYSSSEFSCLISAGTEPFVIDDTFIFRIGNLESPRYVYRDSSDQITDLYGGQAADLNGIGAYQVSRPFINNPYNESRNEVLEGTLYSHFRGILSNQLAETSVNFAFGGQVKNWSEQQTLLASLLMERDLTPISMIDMAQRQYDTGLNTIADTYKQSVAQYFTTNGVVDPDGTPEQQARLNALLDSVLQTRASDNDVRTVLYDSTSGVTGIPATLPQLGILPRVLPSIGFDNLLGRYLMSHHDGHNSSLYVDDTDFRRDLLNNSADIEVLRSDGTSTPAVGSFTTTAPTRPYRGELWIQPNGVQSNMLAFDVDSDLDAPSSPVVGTSWYQRTAGPNGTLNLWDGVQWVAQPTHTTRWIYVNLADTLNQLILLVEQRLYNNINPHARLIDLVPLVSDPEFVSQMERELYTFAANNGVQPLGSDYTPIDSITWNYSNALLADFPPLSTATVPARWYNIIFAHQDTVPGVLRTARPNLEPWRLLGFADFNIWWATLTPLVQASYTPYATPNDLVTNQTFFNAGQVRVVNTTFSVTPLFGLQVIDGVSLNNGDRVLLQNQVGPENNGVYTVSSGAWTRSPVPLNQNTYVSVIEGFTGTKSVWALTATVNTLNVDPVLFSQVRFWSNQLWADVQAARPTLRLSVDTTLDFLLQPYVSPTTFQSANALTTVVPSGIADPYSFGEGGPVETVWRSSIEFGYSIARSLFRHDPLMFLGFCWGFNWVEVDGILYDGYDVNTPGHKRFRLHGDLNRTITRDSTAMTISATAGTPYTLIYDAYEVVGSNRYQNFSIRDVDGLAVAYVREGVTSSIAGLTDVLIEDNGQPFHIGDSFYVSASGTITFTPATAHKYLGFGQTFTQALRETSIDTTDSFAVTAFRGYDVNMGYRAGGLVATDDLNLSTDNDILSTSSFTLLFKKNEISKDLWVQGLRMTVQEFGSSVSKNDALAPKTDAADWVFNIEGYNPRYLNISYYTLDTSGEYVTFNVLDQSTTSTVWKQFTTVTGTVNSFLPLTITGLQNVVNFLFGYSKYLEDEGWVFNTSEAPGTNVDAETGRARTWQLEIEKVINTCYLGMLPDQGRIVNPFSDLLTVRQDTGLLSEFTNTSLFDITGHPGIFDLGGVKMNSSDLYIIRGNESSQITASAPMYSAHVQLDQYEHLFIMNYFVEDSISNGILYDPFSGSRVVTYYFNGRRQASQTFRPEFGGHYLVGNEVRQNLQASTDNITNFYDANRAFENDLTTRHSLALLGFNTKEYFDNLGISDKSQFNFWRGLIQMKGTNASIDAYLNNNRFEDAKIDEYWAYKVAEYGDARQNTYPELKLSVVDTVQQFTQLQFDYDPLTSPAPLTNFTQITRFDEDRWFSIDDLDQDTHFKAEIVGSFTRSSVLLGEQITLPFIADRLIITGTAVTQQLNSTTLYVSTAGSLSIVGYGPATPRYNPVKLFNYVADELVEEIPLWHPATGQHTPTALESINITSDFNPAKYNFSTQVVNNNSYDPLRPWGSNELGRVWFDTRELSYIPYYDETIFVNRAERLSRWGALADFASVDVYEWVQSPVPPSEYNALAVEQAGDADLDPATKAAGEVALQETYKRDRQWFIQPVAWSFATVPDAAAHPSFDNSYDSILYIEGDQLSLDRGLFSDYNIFAGSRIGAWDPTLANPKPLSESIVTNTFTKRIVEITSGLEHTSLPSTIGGVQFQVTLSSFVHTDVAGPMSFGALSQDTQGTGQGTPLLDPDAIVVGYSFVNSLRVTEVDSGTQEIIVISEVSNSTNTMPNATFTTGQVQTFDLPNFGLRVSVRVTTGGSTAASAFRDAIVNALTPALTPKLTVRDAVNFTEVAPWPTTPDAISNNINDPIYFPVPGTLGTKEWRAWTVPSQAELTADSRQPNSSWKPYLGDYVSIPGSLDQIQEAVAYSKAPLTLNNGTVIDRYSTTWTDWINLKNIVYTSTQRTSGPLVITHTSNIDSSVTSVYVNGIVQLSASYTIFGTDVTLANVLSGSIVTVIIRHYEPSIQELAFDPETADDLTFQQQYKQDYDYVSLPVRDVEGALSSTVYYFWVKNKTTQALGKKLSIQSITQQIKSGPPNFLTFQHILDKNSTLPYRYDAITISGLSFVVGKDDTFKLRFTRNFTLRDDPQQLDLKDTHTEWSIIRPGQRTRVPEPLWQKLTDSVAGQDAAGNAVPALRRRLYDDRRGTSTRFGFGPEQTLGPQDLLVSTITYTIVNTKLINTSVPANPDGTYPPDFIEFLDFSQSDVWFDTPAHARQTMTDIWTSAKPSQINEIFFAALNDILASNYELTDIFKTSRLSAYSIKVVASSPVQPTYE